jgi:hypothetical protein
VRAQRNIGAGVPGAHAHSRVVITSLFADDADAGAGAGAGAASANAKARALSRRATYTRVVDAGEPAAACAPPSSLLERKASVMTVYHDAEAFHEHSSGEAQEHAAQAAGVAASSPAEAAVCVCVADADADADACERERFYTERMLQWAHDAALAEAEEAHAADAAGAPLQTARKAWWRRCFLCGGGEA